MTLVSVEPIPLKGVKDAPTPRPNKRLRLGLLPTDREVPPSAVKSTKSTKGVAVDHTKEPTSKMRPQFDEYMNVMQARSKKGPSWANDAQQAIPEVALVAERKSKKGKEQNDERVPPVPENDAQKPRAEDDKGEGMSDLDWMRRRMSQTMDIEADTKERAFEQDEDEDVMDDEVRAPVALGRYQITSSQFLSTAG